MNKTVSDSQQDSVGSSDVLSKGEVLSAVGRGARYPIVPC